MGASSYGSPCSIADISGSGIRNKVANLSDAGVASEHIAGTTLYLYAEGRDEVGVHIVLAPRTDLTDSLGEGISGSQWVEPLSITQMWGNIPKGMILIMPLLMTVGVLSGIWCRSYFEMVNYGGLGRCIWRITIFSFAKCGLFLILASLSLHIHTILETAHTADAGPVVPILIMVGVCGIAFYDCASFAPSVVKGTVSMWRRQ